MTGKRALVLFSLLFLGWAALQAKPRFPFPATPDETGQNDRDLDDQIKEVGDAVAAISTSTLTGGSTNYIHNQTTKQTGAVMNISSGTVDSFTAQSGTFTAISVASNTTIGTAFPKKRLTVIDNSGAGTTPGTNPIVWIGGGTAENSTLSELGFTYGYTVAAYSDVYAPATIGYQLTANTGFSKGDLVFCTRNVTTDSAPNLAMRIGDSGYVSKPLQPSFLAMNSTIRSNVTGDGTQVQATVDVELFDVGGNFASNVFTAPVTGKYSLHGAILLEGLLSGHTTAIFFISTSNRNYRVYYDPIGAKTDYTMALSSIADMDANDTADIEILVAGSTKVVDIYGSGSTVPITFFSGSLIN